MGNVWRLQQQAPQVRPTWNPTASLDKSQTSACGKRNLAPRRRWCGFACCEAHRTRHPNKPNGNLGASPGLALL